MTRDYGLGMIGNAIEQAYRERQDRELGPPQETEAEPDIALLGRNMVARNNAHLHQMQGTPGNRAQRRAQARAARKR